MQTKILRQFGLMVGAVFGIIGIWPWLFHQKPLRLWAVALAAGLIFPALFFPRVLLYPYLPWMKIGHFLGWVNTRIILGFLFYVIFTPVGLFIRLGKGDPLHRSFEKDKKSYRISDENRKLSADDMERQF